LKSVGLKAQNNLKADDFGQALYNKKCSVREAQYPVAELMLIKPKNQEKFFSSKVPNFLLCFLPLKLSPHLTLVLYFFLGYFLVFRVCTFITFIFHTFITFITDFMPRRGTK